MFYDLLVHVDLPDEQRFALALTNIENYLLGLPGEDFTVVVLANAAAVRFLTREGNPQADGVRALAAKGVHFRACNNALKKFEIEHSQLLHCVTVVPTGLAEVVRLQREGYAYIKP